MKRFRHSMGFVLLAALALILGACAADGSDRIANGYFIDRDDTNKPAGWTVYSSLSDPANTLWTARPDDNTNAIIS